MKLYTFRIGNTETRKGHRRDCAAVSVMVLVNGESPADAVARLKFNITASPRIWSVRAPSGYPMSISINPSSVRESDIVDVAEDGK